ncbi:MFS transporter [Candidatus Bathyarchaeota archaeon]|nr:MFS transporter [Candidatus Bathyarchaeota archaeon]
MFEGFRTWGAASRGGSSAKREFGIGVLRGNLFWLVVCQCIWQFTTNIPSPYLPLYIQSLGGSPADIGLVRSAAAIAGLFLYPLGGYIADKQGRVKLVSVATVVYAFSFIPFAFAPNWETLAVASFLQNLVLFYSPILTVLQADSMPAGMRGQGFAVAISVPGALGIISPFIGGYLVDAMGIIPGMRLVYNVGFGAGLFVAALRWVTLRETLDPAKAQKIDYRNIPKVFKDSYLSFLETLRWMPDQIRVLAIMQMTQIFFNGVAASYWILYATAIIGISATTWGLNSAIQGSVNMLFAIPAGRLMDRFGRRRLLIPMMCLVPVFPLAFLFIKDYVGLAVLVVFMSISNAFLRPGFQSLLADYTPRERRGRVTSAVGGGNFFVDIRGTGYGGGMLLFIPAAVAQTLGGVLYEANPTIPFMVMSAGMVIVIVWAFLRVREPVKMET